MQFLYDDAELRFQFLTDLTAVHYPDQQGRELAVVYHLHNLVDNIRIRFKVLPVYPSPMCSQQLVCTNQPTGWKERHSIFMG